MMQPKRIRQIVSLALDYALSGDVEPAECAYVEDVPGVDYQRGDEHGNERRELVIDGHSLMSPTDTELSKLQNPEHTKHRGGARTKQVLRYALTLLLDLNDIPEEYTYYGEVERFAETHVTLDGENFRFPMRAELQELFNDLGRVSKLYPKLSGYTAWDVYGKKDGEDDDDASEFTDTVFFDCEMVGSEVRRSLVDHDGYSDSIVLRVTR